MKHLTRLAVGAASLMLFAVPASAQRSGTLFASAGISLSLPTGSFAAVEGDSAGMAISDIGATFSLSYSLSREFSLIGEITLSQFGINEEVDDSGSGGYTIIGLGMGARFVIPSSSDTKLYIQAGYGRYWNRVEDGACSKTFKPEIGTNLGGGILLPIGRQYLDLRLTYFASRMEYGFGCMTYHDWVNWLGLSWIISVPFGGTGR